MKFLRNIVLAAVLAAPLPAAAQDGTLADIRAALLQLSQSVEGLRAELTATGGLGAGIAGSTPLDRLNAIEAQLADLTARTEALENRINRIVSDGTNRIGDIEFRLCELEPGCDIAALGQTASLGGDTGALTGVGSVVTSVPGPELAVGEQTDFNLAQSAFDSGDMAGAAERFGTFLTSYPGSPLGPMANYLRGSALENLGDMTGAARAYLEAFSTAPTGDVAPNALYRLGAALGALGQVQDACITLGEVAARFPQSAAVADARAAMATYGCQ